jgi:hypothetical protein
MFMELEFYTKVPTFTSPLALEHFQDFIHHTYIFYPSFSNLADVLAQIRV